jgi:hypothetical protein
MADLSMCTMYAAASADAAGARSAVATHTANASHDHAMPRGVTTTAAIIIPAGASISVCV